MKKTCFIITALLSFATLAVAQDAVLSASTDGGSTSDSIAVQTPKFGYLSYDSVIKAMPEYDEAMKSLEELKASYDKELSRAEKDFSKKFAEYLDGQKSFPENIMLKRQKELQQLMDQSIQFRKEAQELLTKAEKDIMLPVKERLAEAVKAVGKESGYMYILNTDVNAYPYISEANGEDCTDKVLEKLEVK